MIDIVVSTDFDSLIHLDSSVYGVHLEQIMTKAEFTKYEVPGHTFILWCREPALRVLGLKEFFQEQGIKLEV